MESLRDIEKVEMLKAVVAASRTFLNDPELAQDMAMEPARLMHSMVRLCGMTYPDVAGSLDVQAEASAVCAYLIRCAAGHVPLDASSANTLLKTIVPRFNSARKSLPKAPERVRAHLLLICSILSSRDLM